MEILCIKGSEDFTKGKKYPIKSHKKRGVITVRNDNQMSHMVLNTNDTHNVPKSYFDTYFTMTKEVENAYEGHIEKRWH